METDFFNFHLGSIASPYYNQGGLEDSESSILENLQNDFSYEPSAFEGSPALWDADGDLSSDIPTLNMGSLDGPFSRGETGYKEDFHKLLTDWNEHLGSLQVSDEEDMDVKDMVKISEKLPEDIFDDSMEKRRYHSGMSPKRRSRVKRIIRSDVKLERSVDGRTDVESDSQIECIDNMMSLDEPEVKIPSFSDDGLLFVPEQPDFLFGECEEEENIPKLNTVKAEPQSGQGSPSGSSIEVEEDCVDVETVSGPVPVLQAGDLTSLLEQFEASEAVNGVTSVNSDVRPLSPRPVVSKNPVPTVPVNFPSNPVSTSPLRGNKGAYGAALPANPLMTNQKIRDSLPIEIIEKIKACGRKKSIAVIPAMPSKRNGQRGTRMQDAGATLSRNKLLKIVSGGQIGGGESVQLDHDYCSSEVARPPSFYHSDASEYISEGQSWRSRRNRKETNSSSTSVLGSVVSKSAALPNSAGQSVDSSQTVLRFGAVDRRVTNVVKNSSDRSRKLNVGCYEKNSKKDSGLESGEVSDAGEEAGSCPSVNLVAPNKHSLADKTDGASGTVSSPDSLECEVQKPKRKLNLQEYRSRREELEKQRVYPVKLSDIPMPKEEYHGGDGIVDEMMSGVNGVGAEKVEVKEVEVVSEQVIDGADGNEKPKMHSVEVQTKQSDDVEECMTVAQEKCSSEEQKRAARSRDRRRRNYRSHHHNRNGSASSNSSVLSHSSYGLASSCSSRSSSTSSLHQGRNRHHHHRGHHSCHCRSGHSRKSRHHNFRIRSVSSGGKSESHHTRRSSPMQRSLPQVKSPSSLTSCGSSPSSSLRSVTPSSQSPSPHRGDGCQMRRRSRRRSHKESEGRRRSCRSHSSCSPSWSSDCSSCYSRSRSPLRGTQHRAKSNSSNCGLAALPPSADWQPEIEREKIRQVEERRVIYVGRLAEGTTKADLRHRFEVFGEIIDISVHFREHGDNYGFVTFAYKVDAYEAVEHGNDDPSLPKYDLCFGGRRAFCKVRYSDLDAMNSWPPSGGGFNGRAANRGGDDSFDSLLREAQAKIRKRQV